LEEETFLDANLKAEIAIEALKGEKTIEEIANQHGISKSQVRKFKRQFKEKSSNWFTNGANSQERGEKMEKNSESQVFRSKWVNKFKNGIKKTGCFFKWNNIKMNSTLILAFFTAILAICTVIMAYYTKEMSHHAETTAMYTRDMANYTNDMALSTKELVLISKNPALHIYCVIKSEFPYSIQNDCIQFKSADYVARKSEIKFYIAIACKWRSNIKSAMNIKYRISVLDKDGFKFKSKIYKLDPINIALGPFDICEKKEVNEIKCRLSGTDFNWRGHDFGKIIEIKIYQHLAEASDYPYAGIDVIYVDIEDFVSIYNDIKKRMKNHY